jgi:hypothetical protein
MTGPFHYRNHDHTADDVGLIEHPAPNLRVIRKQAAGAD